MDQWIKDAAAEIVRNNPQSRRWFTEATEIIERHFDAYIASCPTPDDQYAELRRRAVAAVTAYDLWMDVPGWDVPEYDAVISSMSALADHLGIPLGDADAATPNLVIDVGAGVRMTTKE